MLTFLVILIVIVCLLLSAIILIQNPKGGGVSSTFAGTSQQIFGASKSTDIVEKATWTLAIMLMVFTISSAFFTKTAVSASKDKVKTEESDFEKRLKETGAGKSATPIAPPVNNQQAAPATTAAPATQPK